MEVDMDMGNMGDMQMGPMMKMYFHFRENEPLLFKGWTPGSHAAYILTCLAIFVFGAVFEGLRYARWRVQASVKNKCCDPPGPACEECEGRPISTSSSSTPLTTKHPLPPCAPDSLKDRSHMLDSVLNFAQLFLAYTLMMVSMTYNVPYFLALVLGHTVGYFVAGPLMSVHEELHLGHCCS